MKHSIKKLFSCPQGALYAAILLGITNVLKHLEQFTALKAFYTKEYFDNLEKQVTAAEKLYNEEQRNAITAASRDEAVTSATAALKLWRSLRQYINTAYTGNLLKTKLDRAGKMSYADASNFKWNAIRILLNMGNDFIEANKTALLANQNMPVDFPKAYYLAAQDCLTLIKDFHDSALDKGSQTIIKNQADNELYTTFMSVLLDGQHIFEEQKSVRRTYVFNILLNTVKAKMPAHFTGYATDEHKRPLAGVIINVNDQYSATTDAAGRFEINRLEAGVYPVAISRPNFDTIEDTITFKAGTGKHMRFTLTPSLQAVLSNSDNLHRDEKAA